MRLHVVADGNGVLVNVLGNFLKNVIFSPQMVADEKGIFRSVSRKNFKKNNSAQVGQNFENYLPDNLSGIKNDLQPSWSEVKIQLLTNLDRG